MSHKTWSNLVSLNFLMIFQNCWKLKFEFLVNFSLIENVADHSDNLNTLNLKRDFNVVFAIFEGFVTEIVVSLKNYQLILRTVFPIFLRAPSYISSWNIFEWFGMLWTQHSKSNWFGTCWKPFFYVRIRFLQIESGDRLPEKCRIEEKSKFGSVLIEFGNWYSPNVLNCSERKCKC